MHELAREYYSLGHGQSYSKTKTQSHLNGYPLAGTRSGLVDAKELRAIFEQLHYDQFGHAIEDSMAPTRLGINEPQDWSRFEERTLLRYSRGIVVKRRRPRGSSLQ